MIANRFIYLCAAIVLLLAACGGPPERALRVGNGTEPQALDPHVVTGVPEHHILAALFEGLANTDPKDLHPIPGVAESWTISPDGKTYTFHLREARWSNGEPVTADDFVYAWRRILTPALASEYGYMLYVIKNARDYNEGRVKDFAQVGVKALDARTLEVNLDNPTPYFLSMQIHFTFFPVQRACIEKYGRMDERNTKWTRPGNMVGNGPFRLEKWIPNNVIEVVKNEQYWDAANVKSGRIQFYPIDNQLTEERSFRTGQLHLTDTMPLAKVPVYQRDHPELIHIDPYLGIYFARFNVTRPPFQDVRVRRAFAMALDNEALTKRVLKGGQQPATTFTVPDTAGYTCRSHLEHNPAEARRLLAEAGYPEGRGLPKIEYLYNTSENHKLISEAMQRMWKETLGVDVTLANQDWKVYLDSQKNMDFSMSRGSWIGDVDDAINFLECLTTDNGNNRTGWSSSAYDGLIAQSRRTPDPAQRMECFQAAEKVLLDECPIAPIYYYTRVYLLSPKVRGWQSNVLGYMSWKQIWVEEAQK